MLTSLKEAAMRSHTFTAAFIATASAMLERKHFTKNSPSKLPSKLRPIRENARCTPSPATTPQSHIPRQYVKNKKLPGVDFVIESKKKEPKRVYKGRNFLS